LQKEVNEKKKKWHRQISNKHPALPAPCTQTLFTTVKEFKETEPVPEKNKTYKHIFLLMRHSSLSTKQGAKVTQFVTIIPL
jgi:hypothetical protein